MTETRVSEKLSGWRLGELADEDLASLLALERLCPSTPWSASQWAQTLSEAVSETARSKMPGLWCDQQLVGHAVVTNIGLDAELQAIMVAPAWRRHGVGQRLLKAVVGYAIAWSSEKLLLEVRAGNSAALALYRQAGFELDGVRKGYYAAHAGMAREDACLMSLCLAGKT